MPLPPSLEARRRRGNLALGLAAVAALLAFAITELRKPPPAPAPAPSARATPPAASSAAPPAGAPIAPEITTVQGDDAFRLHVFTIPLGGARLAILDVGMGRDLAGARARAGASLVVNAGFFDAAEKPEGLVIAEGRTLASLSAALGGGVLAVAGERAALFPAEGYAPAPGVTFALQARPRLVVAGKRAIGRDDGKSAERTALCVRDEGRTLEVVVARGEAPGAGPTLALLADMLESRGCGEALNLDGGPSTGVAWREAEGARDLPPRGPVRQAIAVWARE
jgi:uncharacterized protein YigE (DUF2233 family)